MTQEYLNILSKWASYCSRHNYTYIQPSMSDMDEEGDFIVLQNCNGVIARYNTVTGKFTLSEKTARKVESVLYDVAMEALTKHHKDNPSVYDGNGNYLGERVWQQPTKNLTRFTCKYVYLNNINGLLAKYDIKNQRIVA